MRKSGLTYDEYKKKERLIKKIEELDIQQKKLKKELHELNLKRKDLTIEENKKEKN